MKKGEEKEEDIEGRVCEYSGLLRVEEYQKLPIKQTNGRVPVKIQTEGSIGVETEKGIRRAERSFEVEYNRLKEQAEDLIELTLENQRVYSSDIRLTPDVGEIYHLYERKDGTRFVSIVGPGLGLRAEYLGSYLLDEKRVWNKIETEVNKREIKRDSTSI